MKYDNNFLHLFSLASISVRNVRNLPKGNLTVKPDPSDAQRQKYNAYDQMQKLENSYYGTAHDMKYAKTTLLTDRMTASTNAVNETILGGGGGVGVCSSYVTSTPLHRSMAPDYYGTSAANIYDMQNIYQQQQLHQQQQLLSSHPMRRVGSRAEIDMLERETSSQIRVGTCFFKFFFSFCFSFLFV